MEKSEKEINDIIAKHHKQIEQMGKMLLNIYAIASIRFWYSCLANFRKSDDMQNDIFQMEALMTSIIVSYGRIFGKGTGTTVLKEQILPTDLLAVHKEIIDLRHAKYAHHGELSTLEKGIEVNYVNSSFMITPKIEIGIWLGAPKHWAPLFEFLDGYMHQLVHSTLVHLTNETGVEWTFPEGPVPSWIV